MMITILMIIMIHTSYNNNNNNNNNQIIIIILAIKIFVMRLRYLSNFTRAFFNYNNKRFSNNNSDEGYD